MVVRNVLAAETLRMLREECAYFVGYMDAQLDSRGSATAGVTHRGKRYFISNRYRLSPQTRSR